jgi:hypothetical protein
MKASSLAAVLVVAATVLLGRSAQAQTCQQMVSSMKQKAITGYQTRAFLISSQANKVSSSSGRHPADNSWATLDWDAQNQVMTTEKGQGSGGWLQFNDRYYTPSASFASQNFSVRYTQLEYYDLKIDALGTVATIRNYTWNYTITISQLMCSNGLMYGFGNPIGNHNGGKPAMYVLSFTTFPI